MDVRVFGKRGCSECSDTLDYLDENEINYFYYDVEMSEENYKLMVSLVGAEVKYVPVVIIDGEYIGGYTEVRRYFA